MAWKNSKKLKGPLFSYPRLCLNVFAGENLKKGQIFAKFLHWLPASGCESDENPTGWRLEPVRLKTHLLRPPANKVRPEAGQQTSGGRSKPRAGSESSLNGDESPGPCARLERGPPLLSVWESDQFCIGGGNAQNPLNGQSGGHWYAASGID